MNTLLVLFVSLEPRDFNMKKKVREVENEKEEKIWKKSHFWRE
jgi:hypothetical protein